jgi:RND superfamily putative drug exporter
MSALLARVGAFSARRRWFVLIAWIVILVVSGFGAVALSKPFSEAFGIKGLSSIQASDTITHEFSSDHPTTSGKVLIKTSGGAFSTVEKTKVDMLASELAKLPRVTAAVSPFGSSAPGAPTPISNNGRIAYIAVVVDGKSVPSGTSDRIEKLADAANHGTLTVAADTTLVFTPAPALLSSSSLISIALALVVLLITFGALTAAGFTLLTALIGLVIGLLGIVTATHFVDFNSAGLSLAILLGLAVGIDYALFITSRHRKYLLEGMSVADSISAATRTAGSAVFFAALTVIVALAGLSVVGIGFLTQMGLAAAFSVLIAMLVSLTLTPALLAMVGQRLLSRRARRRRDVELATQYSPSKARVASAWMRTVQRRPWLFAIAPVVILAIVALPVFSLQVGLPDAGSNGQPKMQQIAYNLYGEGFGAGVNGPLEVLATYDRDAAEKDAAALVRRRLRSPASRRPCLPASTVTTRSCSLFRRRARRVRRRHPS